MALLSNLLVRIGVDNDSVRRGVNRANRELSRMRDHARRLARDMGRSGSDGGREFSENFWRDANGRLRDERGRFVAAGRGLGDGTGRGFLRGFGRALKRLRLPDLMRALAPLAAGGQAFVALVPILASATTWIANVGSAAIAASPALLALGAAGFILVKSFGAIFAEGSAARKALSGLGEMFTKAAEAGSRAAAKGIAPLVTQLRKVAQPTLTRFMVGLGRAANQVQRDFLRWAASASGLRTLRDILSPISGMLEGLAPHVSRLIISFTKMIGRIMGVSVALGGQGLAGALDWLARTFDRVNADTVMDGMVRLAIAGRQVATVVRTVAGWIKTLVNAYRMYTQQFRLVADALSVVAIIFGGPIVTAIAAAGLIIRHFDEVKAAWERLKAAFSGQGGGPLTSAFQNLKAAAMIVIPAVKAAFVELWQATAPILRDIWTSIKTELVPAFAEFQRALAPVIVWMIGTLLPVVKAVWTGVLNIIKGALTVITGLLRVFTGILNGDWSKVWQGLQTIARGAWQIIWALIKAALQLIWATIRGTLRLFAPLWRATWTAVVAAAKGMMSGLTNTIGAGVGKVKAKAIAIKNAVTGVFRGARQWLVSAGRAILDGLVSGIQSAIGKVRDTLSKVTGMIPSWKGPMAVDLKLLQPSGAALMSGLVDGIRSAVPEVRSALQGVTADIPSMAIANTPGVQRAAAQEAPPIVIRSDGSRVGDLLVEILRRSISDKGGNVQRVLGRG